ncbi:MAG: pyridoxamine 5'-phosphate oxidase family protein [Ilumatobacter sp.]|nr:pyridoxamine 5'-phosphate oxidase family protein [Ilumatobacter sp.]
MLDPKIRDLASTGQNFGTVALTLPNGQIASHVMWVDADDDHIIFNTEVHRAKFRALSDGTQVTVTVWKAESPYAYAEVRGHVAEIVRGDEARAHIDALAARYTGTEYTNPIESERVIVKIAPDRQRTSNL